MLEQARAQLDIDPVGRVRKNIGSQPSENRFKYGNGDESDNQYIERGVATMGQHLIGENLKKQGRNKCKKLQEKRSKQHLAKQAAIFLHCLHKPSDIKALRKIRKRCAARHQEETAGLPVFELDPCNDLRSALGRALH